MDTREDHGSYYPGGEKVIPIREVSGNVKKVNGIAPDAAGNVQVPTDDTDAVRFTAQSLTDAQKSQARSNIGAIASAPVTSVNNKTGAVTLTAEDIKYDEETPLYTKVADTAYTASVAEDTALNAANNLSSHVESVNNPHDVTAAQVGALPTTGGTISGSLLVGADSQGVLITSTSITYESTGGETVLSLPNDGRVHTLATTDDIQSAPVKSVNDETGNVIVSKVYNATGDKFIDGDLKVSTEVVTITGNVWTRSDGISFAWNSQDGSVFKWYDENHGWWLTYNSDNGEVYMAGSLKATVTPGLNPLNGDQIPSWSSGGITYVFTKRTSTKVRTPVATLATTDQIPTVDTTLNPSSANPLANSAVAASLVYDAPDEFTPRVYDEELEGYCYKIKNRKITCVNLTSASADEDWDAVIFRYDGLTFGKSFDAIVFLHCDSSYTAEAFSSGFDATLLMDESLLPTDLEAGSEYVMAITSINSGEVVARIFKKPENGFD